MGTLSLTLAVPFADPIWSAKATILEIGGRVPLSGYF